MSTNVTQWWRGAVIYQIYPRSFADSNGDGVGDIPGIMSRLDHLKWLGVQGIWLNPTNPSPNVDWGYDVSDYKDVHPDYGTLADLEELIRRAAERGMRIMLDLVPNHTSDRHPWFHDALSGRDARHREWYVWADPAPDGGPPNNWLSVLGGGPAWELHEPSGQYFLHNFAVSQPDLNWWNEELQEAFDDILRFWFDRGVAGFRIDVAHGVVKDRQLRDNLPVNEDDHPEIRRLGQRQVYNMNRPEIHDIFRRWREIADSYDDARVLVGETYVFDMEQLASYYGSGTDELHLAFNFPFAFTDFEPKAMARVVTATEKAIPPDACRAWMASNHDVGRFPTRWCDGDSRRARVALMILLTLRGTAFLYYGDEIGMTETEIDFDDLKDPAGRARWAETKGRDPCRTPMQWSAERGSGFTDPNVEPWLPFGDHRRVNVADQRDDASSMLNLCRDLIALRRSSEDLTTGAYEALSTSRDTWVYRRGKGTTVALNLSDDPAEVAGVTGAIALCTQRAREEEKLSGRIELEPWQGVVVGPPD